MGKVHEYRIVTNGINFRIEKRVYDYGNLANAIGFILHVITFTLFPKPDPYTWEFVGNSKVVGHPARPIRTIQPYTYKTCVAAQREIDRRVAIENRTHDWTPTTCKGEK